MLETPTPESVVWQQANEVLAYGLLLSHEQRLAEVNAANAEIGALLNFEAIPVGETFASRRPDLGAGTVPYFLDPGPTGYAAVLYSPREGVAGSSADAVTLHSIMPVIEEFNETLRIDLPISDPVQYYFKLTTQKTRAAALDRAVATAKANFALIVNPVVPQDAVLFITGGPGMEPEENRRLEKLARSFGLTRIKNHLGTDMGLMVRTLPHKPHPGVSVGSFRRI